MESFKDGNTTLKWNEERAVRRKEETEAILNEIAKNAVKSIQDNIKKPQTAKPSETLRAESVGFEPTSP